jgi:hypothetical protein
MLFNLRRICELFSVPHDEDDDEDTPGHRFLSEIKLFYVVERVREAFSIHLEFKEKLTI